LTPEAVLLSNKKNRPRVWLDHLNLILDHPILNLDGLIFATPPVSAPCFWGKSLVVSRKYEEGLGCKNAKMQKVFFLMMQNIVTIIFNIIYIIIYIILK
jgi:hypothetical protein